MYLVKYTIKRLVMLIPVILGVTLILYFVMSLAPGNPCLLYTSRLRLQVLDMVCSKKGGHIGGDLSEMEILLELYCRQMCIRDRLYSAWGDRGLRGRSGLERRRCTPTRAQSQ